MKEQIIELTLEEYSELIAVCERVEAVKSIAKTKYLTGNEVLEMLNIESVEIGF